MSILSELDSQLSGLENGKGISENSEKIKDLQQRIHMQEIAAPIFGANTCEHFINLYASERIHSWYMAEYLEPLDLYSKWMVVPNIVCGEEINEGRQSIIDFKHLIRVRNSLTHAKPRYEQMNHIDELEKRQKKFTSKISDRKKMARRSASIVIALLNELREIDDDPIVEELMRSLNIPVRSLVDSNKQIDK